MHVTFSWSVSMLLFFQAPQVNSTYNETKDVPDVTSLLISWFIFLFCLFFQLCALSLFALLWQLSLKPLPVLVNHVFILLVKKKTSYVNDRSTADITDYAGYIHTIVVFQKIPIPLLQYIFMLPEKRTIVCYYMLTSLLHLLVFCFLVILCQLHRINLVVK